MNHYVYKLVPPRPTFGLTDMSEQEAAIMQEHGAYWSELLAAGTAIVFGPVEDPSGNWGLAVVEAPSEVDVHAIRASDPAVASGLATAEILAMPVALTREQFTAP